MPIYEYECQSCSHRFEEWQKMSDKPITVCPKCKARKVEKLISHTSFQLKGGGWYSDLYSSQKPGSGGSGSTSPEASGEKPAAAAGADKSNSTAAGSDKSSSTPTASESKSKGKKGASKAAA